MNINDIKQIQNLKIEAKYLVEKINKIKKAKTIVDVIKNHQNLEIYSEYEVGLDLGLEDIEVYGEPLVKKLLGILIRRYKRIAQTINEVDEFVNSLKDEELKKIIILKWYKGLTWVNVTFKLYDYEIGEDAVRAIFKRRTGKYLKEYNMRIISSWLG